MGSWRFLILNIDFLIVKASKISKIQFQKFSLLTSRYLVQDLTMKNIFLTLQIVTALITIVLVIIQSKGTGIGSTFGGDMGFYGTKRGAEKLMFVLTIVVAFIFVASSLAAVLLS